MFKIKAAQYTCSVGKMYRKNLLRQKLQAGEKLIGTWHQIPDPIVTERF